MQEASKKSKGGVPFINRQFDLQLLRKGGAYVLFISGVIRLCEVERDRIVAHCSPTAVTVIGCELSVSALDHGMLEIVGVISEVKLS